jgi:hypothetical protein
MLLIHVFVELATLYVSAFAVEIRCIRVEKKHPNVIFYKTDFDQVAYGELRQVHTGNISKQPDHLTSAWSVTLKSAYSDLLPITKEKKQDLLSLCSSKAIPDDYHDFYRNLPVATSSVMKAVQNAISNGSSVTHTEQGHESTNSHSFGLSSPVLTSTPVQSVSPTSGKGHRKTKVLKTSASASSSSPVLSSTPFQKDSFFSLPLGKRLRSSIILDSGSSASTDSSSSLVLKSTPVRSNSSSSVKRRRVSSNGCQV